MVTKMCIRDRLIGFASVNFGGVVVDDFKVVNGQNGVFLGAPSKPDPTSRSGYRATVRINDRATQERLNAAGVQAYNMAVEKLLARAEAVRPAPIREPVSYTHLDVYKRQIQLIHQNSSLEKSTV